MRKEVIRIIAVDDHPIVLQGLQIMLQSQTRMDLVGLFPNCREAVVYTRSNEVDVALVDLHMPDTDGIGCSRSLLTIRPVLKIIALTMVSDLSVIKRMLDAGAMGYLLKNAGQRELIRAIDSVMKGKKYLSDEVEDLVLADFLGKRKSPSHDSPFPKLTRRETEVLRLIVDERTTGQIAEELSISFGTVETHRRNMMSKLSVKNTAGLVRVALQHKLI